jgi:hypothetical protein
LQEIIETSNQTITFTKLTFLAQKSPTNHLSDMILARSSYFVSCDEKLGEQEKKSLSPFR